MTVSAGLARWRNWLLAGIGTTITAVGTGEAIGAQVRWQQAGWIFCALVGSVVAAANATPDQRIPKATDAVSALRTCAIELSAYELSTSRDVLSSRLDSFIPLTIATGGASESSTFASFVATQAAATGSERWIVEGPPGAGKSTLLHRLALTINGLPDGKVAIVIPLATYDWTRAHFVDWLAQEVGRLAHIASADAKALIMRGSVLLLLDGLESVPTRELLSIQALPATEVPLFDRFVRRRQTRRVDPQEQLASRLHDIDNFVLSVRTEGLTDRARDVLRTFPRVVMNPIPEATAVQELSDRLPLGTELAPPLIDTIRSPLYLRLACEVCGDYGVLPDPALAVPELKSWLWDEHLDARLQTSDSAHLNWEAPTVRAWLEQYAAASVGLTAVSFRRWPLLFSDRVRVALRSIRSIICGALLGALGLLVVTPPAALILAVVSAAVFYAAGEGAATRSMAPRPFGPARFFHEMVRQWPYAFAFAGIGAACGLLSSSGWTWAVRARGTLPLGVATATGMTAGVVLGSVVASLYELSYVDDVTAYRDSHRSALLGTIVSSVMVGSVAGLLASLVLYVEFPRLVVFLAVPLCVLAMLADTLACPSAAVILWALRGRGPVRVKAFLTLLTGLQLARSQGEFYFLEHSELQRFLAAEAPVERSSETTRRLTAALAAGVVGLWLIGYALVYLRPSLPSAYYANHWRLLWVGFDLFLALVAVLTMIFILRRSAMAALSSTATAVLLLMDGWFDCLTANSHDLAQSVLSLGGEIPAAAFFFWLAIRLLGPAASRET